MVRLSFLPREEKFFFLLHQSTMNLQKASRKLVDLMQNYENVPEKVAEIKELEEFGDQVIHDVMAALYRTFVTPIDREDIAALAERLDDVMDAVEEAARLMLEYNIPEPTKYALQVSEIIVQCADQLETAVARLHLQGGKLREILPATVELNRLENEADRVLSKAMGELFSNGADPLMVLKWRDIYHNLEEATDLAEDAANVLEGIVLKNA